MSLIAGAMLIVFVADLAVTNATDGTVNLYSYLAFNRAAIFKGEVWRIISFIILYPADSNILFTLLGIYFFYWTGNAVETRLGKAKFNLYYLFGILGSIIAGFIVGGMVNTYLNLSLFLAFAFMFPDIEVLLFFILPIKVKWLGIFEGVLLVLMFFLGGIVTRAALIIAFLNFLLFFGNDLINVIKRKYREYKWRRGR